MKRLFGQLLDLVWPRTCPICSQTSDRPDRHICSDCLMRLPFMETRGLCRKCGRDAIGLDGEFLCEDCRVHKPAFDRAVSVFRFEGEARDLINGFKFREMLFLADDLADVLEAAVRVRFRLDDVSCIVPMPITIRRRWLRGYNQSVILARALAKRLKKPYRYLLRRTGHPDRQGGLSEEARRTNVLGTFAALRGAVRHPVVLLIDDIMTTGSTLSEAARTLKAAGVKTVYCASIAHSVR